MYLWDIWTIPLIFVIAVIAFICIYAESKSRRTGPVMESRDEISDSIIEHPFTLNPVILAGIVGLFFMFIIIGYYALLSPY